MAMRTILAFTAALVVGGSLPASAQVQPNIAAAPADRSTGPTVPPLRSVDLDPTVLPSTGTGSNGNDRLAAGSRDTDPHNSTGTPSQGSRLGTSPLR